MNAKRMERHYDKLNIRERVTLIINALGRDDKDEVARLFDTAPRVMLDVPDCGRAVQRYSMLIAHHAIRHLETCAMLFYFALFEGGDELDLDGTTALLAWNIIARAEAWKTVCAELGLDPVGALAMFGLPKESAGAMLMDTAEQVARKITPTLKQVQDALKRHDGKKHPPRTTEQIAAEYRELMTFAPR